MSDRRCGETTLYLEIDEARNTCTTQNDRIGRERFGLSYIWLEGNLVELATLLENGPLVVSFNRGPWCDYCGLELHSLARAYPDVVAAGGDVISIVPETAKLLATSRQSAASLSECWPTWISVMR